MRWIFSGSTAGFNPAVGFWSVATTESGERCEPRHVSIPQWVSGPSRRPSSGLAITSQWFQSRSGFLVRRDGLPGSVQTRRTRVSIPQWVSGPSRLAGVDRLRDGPTQFQSRSGFLVRRDEIQRWYEGEPFLFQSRSGFLVRRDGLEQRIKLPFRQVSIPQWVSGPSRRPTTVAETLSQSVSIPQWVSGPSRRELGCETVLLLVFQSRSGFLVRRDKCAEGVHGPRPSVSIPQWVSGPSRLTGYPISINTKAAVSIPQWVSGPSRPSRDRTEVANYGSFNPAVGFWSVAT